MAVERHYFPGNNTPKGFYSCYRNILGQREARKILCIKGGPGTGKSTFIRHIGEAFLKAGEDVDFLHCSADEDSLDGILIHGKKTALFDGTSPHITDPMTPGAVDRILNLGEFWDEKKIREQKEQLICINEKKSIWYDICYNYLAAASAVERSLEKLYHNAVSDVELYRTSEELSGQIFQNLEFGMRKGIRRKFFASAVTASGTVHYLDSMLSGISSAAENGKEQMWERIYIISSPTGYSAGSILEFLAESAIYRGLDIDTCYCSMAPDTKLEHLLIPGIGTAFITVNEYHDLEPWEILQEGPEIVLMDLSEYMDSAKLEEDRNLIRSLKMEYDILIEQAVKCLNRTRLLHEEAEKLYLPYMDFQKVEQLEAAILEELMDL